MTPLKSVSEVWSRPAALKEWLEGRGFRVSAAAELSDSTWRALKRPASSDSKPSAELYAYVTGDHLPQDAALWAWLLVDAKVAAKLNNAKAWVLDAPDAALDAIVRELATPEWAGVSAAVPADIVAESGVVIGPNCVIGEGCVLEAGVRLGARVRLGRGCRIRAHARIADDVVLGDECDVGAGCSLGGQGFGFVRYPRDSRPRLRIHVGGLVVGDRVRFGAGVYVDRGVLASTTIGTDTAFDNMVQVAHNCAVGESSVICSFVGLSGSTILGKNVTIAGMVGTKGHLRIGDGATVAGQSGVTHDIPDGAAVKGYPTLPIPEALKLQVLIGRLPELFDKVKTLSRKVEP